MRAVRSGSAPRRIFSRRCGAIPTAWRGERAIRRYPGRKRSITAELSRPPQPASVASCRSLLVHLRHRHASASCLGELKDQAHVLGMLRQPCDRSSEVPRQHHLALGIHHLGIGGAGLEDGQSLAEVQVATVRQSQPLRQHDPMQAEHQVDDELGRVAAADRRRDRTPAWKTRAGAAHRPPSSARSPTSATPCPSPISRLEPTSGQSTKRTPSGASRRE